MITSNRGRIGAQIRISVRRREKYSEIVTSKYGVVSAGSSEVPMSNIRFASYRRELEKAFLNLLLKALDAPGKVSSLSTKPSTVSRGCRPSPSPTATSSSPSCLIPRPAAGRSPLFLTTTGSTGTSPTTAYSPIGGRSMGSSLHTADVQGQRYQGRSPGRQGRSRSIRQSRLIRSRSAMRTGKKRKCRRRCPTNG
jgi:hypothetical protein